MPALFGVQVHYTWTHKCKQVGLELAAVVGRPLYMCTCTKSNGKMCGMLAAMSPLMEQKDKHKPFSCKDCASHHVAEHQALPVRRLLRLYAQVRVDDKCVAMRSTPMHILVYAPKDDAVWGIGHQAPDQMSDKQPVSPKRVQILNNTGFEYDERDSENIWMHATHFQNSTIIRSRRSVHRQCGFPEHCQDFLKTPRFARILILSGGRAWCRAWDNGPAETPKGEFVCVQ